jgi:hydroxyacylglutathione hydrolase
MKKILIRSGVGISLVLLLCGLVLVKIYFEVKKMSPMDTREIVKDVYAVQDGFVNLFLIKNADTYIAIDAGNNAEHIQQELARLHIDPKDVVAVFLTHSDVDHIAALSLFKNAVIYLSRAEEQMINGETSRFLFMKNRLGYPHELLEDNQVINISGLKIKGILAPGHTPGSMCYLINNNYLFTGDSLGIKNGKVKEFNKIFNMDTQTQRLSLGNLADLSGVEYVFTAHYGFTDDFQKAFENWKNP